MVLLPVLALLIPGLLLFKFEFIPGGAAVLVPLANELLVPALEGFVAFVPFPVQQLLPLLELLLPVVGFDLGRVVGVVLFPLFFNLLLTLFEFCCLVLA
jgi:hypothetical protein